MEAGRGDDDVGVEPLSRLQENAGLLEPLDLVGDDGRFAAFDGLEQIGVGDEGDALPPGPITRREMLLDIGIGIGPFNLGLAALSNNIPNLDTKFFDRNASFNWHPGLLMAETRLQVPFFADLVTPADPTSQPTLTSTPEPPGTPPLPATANKATINLTRSAPNAALRIVARKAPEVGADACRHINSAGVRLGRHQEMAFNNGSTHIIMPI